MMIFGGRRTQPALAYAVAVVGICLVDFARVEMGPIWGDRYPYSLFFAVLLAAAWIGGRKPGFLAMLLGWASVVWLMPLLGIYSAERARDWMGQFLYLGQSTLIVIGFASMRRQIELLSENWRTEQALKSSQKRLEKSLIEAEINLKRLNLIESAVNLGTWEFDVNTGISNWPAGISSLWGLPAKQHQIPFDEFVSRIYEEDRERVTKTVETALMTGDSYEVEFRVVWPDRSIHWLAARGAVLRNEAGDPYKVIGIALDVTQRLQTERALRESEKLAATGRMAATIAHEINNPLEAVVNLVYLAKNDPGLSLISREYLDNADTELARISHMVRQTLGFYRDNSIPTWLDLGNMAKQIASLYHNKLLRKNVKLDLQVHPAEIFGVEGELRQVVSNLISNAIDAVAMNGQIRIRVRKFRTDQDAFVRILVADNGHGVEAGNRSKLFQPFFTTKARVGTGLGLWVSKGIIDKHNGHVRLRTSTHPKHSGTVFRVDLPAGHEIQTLQSASAAI